MAEYASHIHIMRKEYTERLTVYANSIIKEISDGKEELKISYKSDISDSFSKRADIEDEYRRIFTDGIEKEKIVGSSLYGVHRDDLIIDLNGKSARHFASQGQQRSIVLAMKLAEGEVNRDISGEYPVFLFDDVLSELDEERRKYIIGGIGNRQIIITSCEKDSFEIPDANKIEVSQGSYKS